LGQPIASTVRGVSHSGSRLAVVLSPGMTSLDIRRDLDDGTDFAGQYRSGSRRAAELYLVALTSMVNLDNSPLLVSNHDDRLFRNRFSPSHRPSPYRDLLLHQQAFPGKMHVPDAKQLLPSFARTRLMSPSRHHRLPAE
jgi:hypothetical protein